MMRKLMLAATLSTAAVVGATQTTPEAAAFFNDGIAKTNAGQYDDAVAAFEKSLTQDPNLIEAHEWIAHILILKGDYEGAIARYQLIVARRPSTDSKVSLGLAYLRVGKVDAAVSTLENATTADPSNHVGWNNLSLAYLRKDDVAAARRAAEKSLALKPDYPPALVNLGNTQLRGAEYEDAKATFQQALELDAAQVEGYYGLAEAYAALGDAEAAGDNYVLYIRGNGADDVRRAAAVQWLWDHGRGAEAR